MAATRLRSSDADIADAQVAARAEWCRRILEETPRSLERREAIEASMAALGMSKSAIYAMVTDYRKSGRTGLTRKQRSDKGGRRSLSEGDLALWIQYATDPRRVHWPKSQLIRKYRQMLASAHQELPCSDATLERALDEVDPAFQMTARERSRSRKRQLAMGAAYGNHVWQADQRTADVDVVDTGTGEVYRPFLFHFVDVFSGLEMGGGYYRRYDTDAVEAALLDAIYPNARRPFSGVPEWIYWDNGKQHTTHWIRSVAQTLGIELHYSIPKEPTSHGFVEGTHTIHQRWEMEQPCYLGGDNQSEKRPLRARLADEGEAPPEQPLTLAQLNAEYRDWLADELDHAEYRKGASRSARWLADTSPERREVPEPTRLALDFMHKAEVSIRGGCFQHRTVVYTAPHLGDLDGLRCEIRFLSGSFQRVFLMLHGEVYATAMPRDVHLYGSDDSYRDLKQRNAELRQTKRRMGESREALEAAAAEGLVGQEEAAQAAEVLEETGRALKPAAALGMQRQREQQSGLAEVITFAPRPGIRAADPPPNQATAIDALLSGDVDETPAGLTIDDVL